MLEVNKKSLKINAAVEGIGSKDIAIPTDIVVLNE
jgi:hypothetical protein